MNQLTKSLAITALLLLAAPVIGTANDALRLPELGDASSSLFSTEHEHKLGRAWLRVFRSQVRTVDDPLLQDYLEELIYTLVPHSELEDRRLELVVVDNPTMNAFAVPGGIIGIHTGLLLYADNEAQLASVLTHELAHLSQRHFARSVEAQQRAAIPTMAGLLASLVVAATAGGDAGMAAISATQAAALQNQLRYSRQHEQEADRIGMRNLVAAGFDANAAPAMFDNMLDAYRYAGKRPPEFLLTHPLTENRISDTRNRARQYPRGIHTDNLDYQLMRARVELEFAENTAEAIKRFKAKLEGQSRAPVAAQYGLVLAYTRAGKLDDAREQLAPLLEREPNRVAYLIAAARIDAAAGDLQAAIERLKQQLKLVPENHPLTMVYAELLRKANMPHRAEQVLQRHAQRRPRDPAVWYQLAETQGLAGNIVGVHQSRAEFFILTGRLDAAQRQLGYALPLVKDDHLTTARIKERIKQVQALIQETENL